jgi:16S rRNA (guanine527-N7)-methyltransferase
VAGHDHRELLIAGAAKLGMSLSDAGADSCLVYLAELMKWNRKMNLTAIRDERDVIIKHFLDSFVFRKGFSPFPGMSLLDIGSGAGFPALPLKILCPDVGVTMVESVGKKAAFLRHIVRTLRLPDVKISESRVESLPGSQDGVFDVVTGRAFAAMEQVVAKGRRFLNCDGVMVLSRGPEEMISTEVLDNAGMLVDAKINIALPLTGHRRVLWVFRKRG